MTGQDLFESCHRQRHWSADSSCDWAIAVHSHKKLGRRSWDEICLSPVKAWWHVTVPGKRHLLGAWRRLIMTPHNIPLCQFNCHASCSQTVLNLANVSGFFSRRFRERWVWWRMRGAHKKRQKQADIGTISIPAPSFSAPKGSIFKFIKPLTSRPKLTTFSFVTLLKLMAFWSTALCINL